MTSPTHLEGNHGKSENGNEKVKSNTIQQILQQSKQAKQNKPKNLDLLQGSNRKKKKTCKGLSSHPSSHTLSVVLARVPSASPSPHSQPSKISIKTMT